MSTVNEEDELVEDRFDDQSFEDAPLSDVESNFDEDDLKSVDDNQEYVELPLQQYCPSNNWNRPALSTIPEESKTDDIVTSEISQRSLATIPNRSDEQSSSYGEFSITRAFSVKSSEFITDQKASDILQREEESFIRGHGRFIPDDPRFNRSHFEKENSWEPSIIDQTSFQIADKTCPPSGLPVPPKVVVSAQEADNELPKSIQERASGDVNAGAEGDIIDKHVQFRAITPTEDNVASGTVLTNLTNKQRDDNVPDLNAIRSTPQRFPTIHPPSLMTNESPNPNSDSTIGGVQTSTPVSVVAKQASRTRRLELAENFHGVSVILPEGESIREGQRTLNDQSVGEITNTTILSVGKIQSILKSQPASSSPRTLMKVLDEYKRERVKARRIRGNLPPPPQRNPNPVQPSRGLRDGVDATSSNGAKVTSISPGDSSKPTEVITSRALETAKIPASVDTVASCISKVNNRLSGSRPASTVSQQSSISQERTTREDPPSSRPDSARSSSSLSSAVGVRSSSQMSTGVASRSVLHIPRREVAFGFVAVGDAAISTVDVTNRTDHSLRLRAKLSQTGTPFTLLDSQILVLDAHRTTSLRIEFSPTQNARFYTKLLISAEGGGGPQVGYRMPVRGVGGAAVVTVKARDDLRISRNGTYVLQSSYESTFSFTLTNSGNRRAFSRIVVLYTGESNVAEQVPVDIRPSPGMVIDRGDSKQVSVRLRSPLPSLDWRSSQNSLTSTTSSQPKGANQLQVLVYWGEERTRQRLRCFEKISGAPHLCEGMQFTDNFDGEGPPYQPPEDYPISKEDVRLFDQTLRMCTIYVCSLRIRPRSSLASNTSSLERSLQPEDTFREKTIYRVIPDQTLR
nr:CRE-SPD-2 protein [Haemonchus contortus]